MAKIGICGTHSTGKTTLLNALRSEKVFKDYQVCDEVTRTVKAMGIPINEDGTDLTQRLVMNQHIVNLALYDNMITDRTAIDGLIYTEWLYENGKVGPEILRYAGLVANRLIHQYDVIFWLQPEFPVVEDGVRSSSVNFRDTIHKGFEDYFKNLQETFVLTGAEELGSILDKVVPITGSVRVRTEQVLVNCKKRELINEY